MIRVSLTLFHLCPGLSVSDALFLYGAFVQGSLAVLPSRKAWAIGAQPTACTEIIVGRWLPSQPS
jgi:hypothetical protein